MKGFIPKLRKASPTILTVTAAVGVIGTVILAVKGDRKASTLRFEALKERNKEFLEKPTEEVEFKDLSLEEEVKLTWKCYIPAIALGAATITSIFASNVLNKRQIAAVTGAYVMLDQTYKRYKEKIIELYGKETDEKVRKEVVKEQYKQKREQKEAKEDDGKLLFYEEHYGKYFRRKMEEVMDAEYRINRDLAQNGEASLNDFFEYLGLDDFDAGDALGWSQEGICDFFQPAWIDFEHDIVELEGGNECYIINILVKPLKGYDIPF